MSALRPRFTAEQWLLLPATAVPGGVAVALLTEWLGFVITVPLAGVLVAHQATHVRFGSAPFGFWFSLGAVLLGLGLNQLEPDLFTAAAVPARVALVIVGIVGLLALLLFADASARSAKEFIRGPAIDHLLGLDARQESIGNDEETEAYPGAHGTPRRPHGETMRQRLRQIGHEIGWIDEREKRDGLIVEAIAEGHSLEDVAEASGLTEEGVLGVLRERDSELARRRFGDSF